MGTRFSPKKNFTSFRNRILRDHTANPTAVGNETVAQTLHHLNLPVVARLVFMTFQTRAISYRAQVFRWILVDWYPEQPVGLRLPNGFKIPPSATFDFGLEKEQLLKILDSAWHARSAADWQPHPMFGPMTVKEWGQAPANPHRLSLEAIRRVTDTYSCEQRQGQNPCTSIGDEDGKNV